MWACLVGGESRAEVHKGRKEGLHRGPCCTPRQNRFTDATMRPTDQVNKMKRVQTTGWKGHGGCSFCSSLWQHLGKESGSWSQKENNTPQYVKRVYSAKLRLVENTCQIQMHYWEKLKGKAEQKKQRPCCPISHQLLQTKETSWNTWKTSQSTILCRRHEVLLVLQNDNNLMNSMKRHTAKTARLQDLLQWLVCHRKSQGLCTITNFEALQKKIPGGDGGRTQDFHD